MAEDGKADKVLKAAAVLVKLASLQTKLAELQEHQRAIVEEMGHLLAGGPGINELLKRLEAHYSECWRVRYGTPYTFQFQKDVPNLKRLIKTLGVEEIERRMLAYLRNADGYFVKARHSFGLFVSSINQHATIEHAGGELELELQNEVDATDRMLGDLRGAKR